MKLTLLGMMFALLLYHVFTVQSLNKKIVSLGDPSPTKMIVISKIEGVHTKPHIYADKVVPLSACIQMKNIFEYKGSDGFLGVTCSEIVRTRYAPL